MPSCMIPMYITFYVVSKQVRKNKQKIISGDHNRGGLAWACTAVLPTRDRVVLN